MQPQPWTICRDWRLTTRQRKERSLDTIARILIEGPGASVYRRHSGLHALRRHDRFQSAPFGNISEVQVSKGYSSPLLGPNGMGGAVNLVTRQPEKKFQADVLMGTGSGDQLLSSVNIGSRWEKFYFQGTFDWLQSDYFPLSGNFPGSKFHRIMSGTTRTPAMRSTRAGSHTLRGAKTSMCSATSTRRAKRASRCMQV